MEEVKLKLEDFSLSFPENGRLYPAVEDVNIEIRAGEMVALIGESGCGKSVTALSVIGLQPESARLSGSIKLDQRELIGLSMHEWTQIRGKSISMIFQEPMSALNPLICVGKQVLEAVLAHRSVSRSEAKKEVIEMMERVGLADAEKLYKSYPHQLSGGQRQRIMIAMAFINDPQLLIADEPTTALDVTIQAQIMELMRRMNRESRTAVLLISHNLGLVKSLCSRVYIMYAGRIVESGSVEEIMKNPLHPYTKGLIASIPDAKTPGDRLETIPGTVPALEERSGVGCGFCDRCSARMEVCAAKRPERLDIACGQTSAQQDGGEEHIRSVWCHAVRDAQMKYGGGDGRSTDNA